MSKKVTMMAMAIPNMPKKFPFLDVSGDDNPLRANMKRIPEIKYKDAAKSGVIAYYFLFSFFYTFATFSALP